MGPSTLDITEGSRGAGVGNAEATPVKASFSAAE